MNLKKKMKIIISHDIDHVNFTEHYKELIVPKYLARGLVEYIKGMIKFNELCRRFLNVFKIRFNRLEELTAFNATYDLNETYFIGVNNGLGLSYSKRKAKYLCSLLKSKGVDYGVHGIDFDCELKINKEFSDFKAISGLDNFGIRMHYLRHNSNTFECLNSVGYLYDATEIGLKNPYRIGNMWEFPIQIMDSYLMCEKSSFQCNTLQDAKQITIDRLNEAERKNLNFFSILLHDIYFDNAFLTWKEWYIWVIEYLSTNGYEFISYKKAILELEKKG